MNEILKYFVKSLSNSTLSLKKMAILLDKPWALIDEDGAIQKLIFKKDKGLILSINGKVTIGSWDYFPEAKALLIDRVNDKLLLKEQFIDENVLILKMDGTDNDFFALANENSISDYNIPKYLNSLKCKQLNIYQQRLLSGNILQINYAQNGYLLDKYAAINNYAEQIDDSFNVKSLSDGKYLSKDKNLTFYVESNTIKLITENEVKKLVSQEQETNGTIEIEDGKTYMLEQKIGKKVTVNGVSVSNNLLKDCDNIIYQIEESIIMSIVVQNFYELTDGKTIMIEQKASNEINKGDKIYNQATDSPLPDGTYKIKGRFWKIGVKNGEIV